MKERAAIPAVVGLLLVLGLLAAGCESGTSTIPAFTSPLQATAEAIALERYATQSAAEVGAAEAAAQATAQAAIYGATQVAAEAQAERERWLATQQAAHVIVQAQLTADALQQSIQSTAFALTAQADAERWRATQEAARSTAQADADRATAIAQVEMTRAVGTAQAEAARGTQEARITATAETYRATQTAYQATATRQAQQREEVLAYGRDYGVPLVLLIIAAGLGALIIYGLRQYAKRPIVYNRSPLGDAPLLAAPTPDGGWNLLDADRQPGHITRLLGNGTVEAPQFRSAGQEERTTARDQVVDQTTRPKMGPGHKGGQTSALPLAPPPTPPAPGLRSVRILRRLDQAHHAGFLPGPMVEALQADWEVEE